MNWFKPHCFSPSGKPIKRLSQQHPRDRTKVMSSDKHEGEFGVPQEPKKTWEFQEPKNLLPDEPQWVEGLENVDIYTNDKGTFAKNDGVWEQIDEAPMDWPQALSSVVVALCVTALFFVFMMLVWGPWGS